MLTNRNITLLFVVALFLESGVIKAGLADQRLSWQQCKDQAARENAELKSAKENLRSSEFLSKGAYSGYYPQITANLGYTYGETTTSATQSNLSATTNYTASITGTQNLFTGFQDRARVLQASANEEVDRAFLQTTQAKTSFDLKSGYEGVVFSLDLIQLNVEIVRRREENFRLVELRFESGRENKGSVLLAKAYRAQAGYEELQGKDALRVAKVQLAKVLGEDAPENVFLDVTAADPIPISDLPKEELNFEAIALSTPEYKQSLHQTDSAEAAVTLARGAYFPALNVTGTKGKQGADFFPQYDRWSIGLNLTLPLFSGGKDYYSAQSASALSLAAQANRQNASRTILSKIQQAYTAYRQSIEKMKVDALFLQAAQTRAEIARNKYNNGLLSFEEWDLIENDLIARQKTWLQSKRDRVINEAAWEQAQGKGVIQ